MNTWQIISIIGIVLVISGGLWYYYNTLTPHSAGELIATGITMPSNLDNPTIPSASAGKNTATLTETINTTILPEG